MKRVYLQLLIILLAMPLSLHAQQKKSDQSPEKTIPLSADSVKPLQTGEKIPEVSLATAENTTFDLNEYVKNQPVVLIFYRGGWCPYCNIHLRELQKVDTELRKMGFEILAISHDKPEKLRKSIEKHSPTYTLLSDTLANAATAFDIAFRLDDAMLTKYKNYGMDLEEASGESHHLLPVPSVFIIGKDGIIHYVYYNADYKNRLKADELISQAKKAIK